MMLFDQALSEQAAHAELADQADASFKLSKGPTPNTYVMHGATNERAVETYHLILAPTHACNLRCEHCYLPDHAGQSIRKNVALQLMHEWNDIAYAETPDRKAIFHIKGGEPLVYKPFLAMLEQMKVLPHLHFMMTTNATLFSSKHLHALSLANQYSGGSVTVVVSLDGATPDTHELLRGSGTFAPTLAAIRNLRDRGVRTYINSVLHSDNINEIDQLVNLALENEVAQINFLPLVPKGFGKGISGKQLPHAVVLEHMKNTYWALPAEKRTLLAGSLPDIIANEESGAFIAGHECVAGYRGLLYVKPNGNAFTCPNLEHEDYAVGNVNSQSVRTILDGLSQLYRSLHSDGESDRFICMGERKLYEKLADTDNLKSLHDLERILTNVVDVKHPRREVSFCVSRNW